MCRGPLRSQDLNETPVVSGQTPYSNDLTWTRTFTHPGAALTRVCFTGFDVENYYDTVEIRDGADHIVEVLTGRKNPVGGLASFCSAWLQGDTAKVLFRTDGSVTGTGFVLRRVESRKAFHEDARFPGQWLDRDTEVKSSTTGALLYSGLHQNWHREFDPDTGRYLTPDPLGLLAGSNLFAYAHNDPLHHADPTGLHPILIPVRHVAQRYGPAASRFVQRVYARTRSHVQNFFQTPPVQELALARQRVLSHPSVQEAANGPLHYTVKILREGKLVDVQRTVRDQWGECGQLASEISRRIGNLGFTQESMDKFIMKADGSYGPYFGHIWIVNRTHNIVIDRAMWHAVARVYNLTSETTGLIQEGQRVFTIATHRRLMELLWQTAQANAMK